MLVSRETHFWKFQILYKALKKQILKLYSEQWISYKNIEMKITKPLTKGRLCLSTCKSTTILFPFKPYTVE